MIKIICFHVWFLFFTIQLGAFSTFISPDPTVVDTPEVFEININVDADTTKFRGYKLIFSYNDSMMEFVSAEKGPLMLGFPIYWWRVVEESSDTIRIECIIMGAGLYVDGPGTILVLTFNGLVEEITELNFVYQEFYYAFGGGIIPDLSTDDGTIIIGSAFLSIPQDVKIYFNEDDLNLKWNSVIGANGYKIFSNQDPYSEFENIGTTPDTTFVIPNITGSKKFFYITADTDLFRHE